MNNNIPQLSTITSPIKRNAALSSPEGIHQQTEGASKTFRNKTKDKAPQSFNNYVVKLFSNL